MHVSLDEWRATVLGLAALAPDRTEEAPLEGALGRRLAEPLTARLPAPDFRMSAMDGFAVSTRELGLGEGDSDACPAHLEVTCDISAGRAAVGNRRPGTAARIMTGGLMPDDLDTVIPVEFTDADPTAAEAPARIALTIPEAEEAKALTPGRHVRKVGEEIPAGDLLARKGDFVTPQIIGIALSVGVTHVKLTRPRRVATKTNYGMASSYSIVLFCYICLVAFVFIKLLGADVLGESAEKKPKKKKRASLLASKNATVTEGSMP